MNPPSPARAVTIKLLGLLVLLLFACAVRLDVGSSAVGWPAGENASQLIEARSHRMWSGVIVGAALALSGVSLQALLRNPLAEPYILGLSSGAAMGVMLQMLVMWSLQTALFGYQYGAVLGALSSMAAVYVAGRKRGVVDPLGLLLTGVVLSTINGALIMFFQYMAGPGGLRDDLTRWMMGYISEGIGGQTVSFMGIGTMAIALLLFSQGRAMDVATLSESEAMSLGVNIHRLRQLLFASASILTAGAVVLAGPVSFVGLICPHLARLILGPGHRPLLIGSALLGAALIVLADSMSSLLALKFGVGLMPIGIFTAILGGPVFLWMLRPQIGRGTE